MRRLSRRALLTGTAALAACRDSIYGDEPERYPALPDRPPADAGATAFDDAGYPRLECEDRPGALPLATLVGAHANGPYPSRLSSWTTREQAEARRASEPLLSRRTTSDGKRGYLFDLLEAEAQKGNADAAALAGKDFELGRFGWPFACGTRISPEGYGDVVLAIDLRPEATVVVIDARLPSRLDVRTLAGDPVEDGIRDKKRIGAFFFTNTRSIGNGTAGGGCFGPLVYRETYVGNPSMVAGFSFATPEIFARLDAEIADLRNLARSLDCTEGLVARCGSIAAAWDGRDDSRANRLYRSLAFANPYGRTDGLPLATLDRLADDLAHRRALRRDDAVTERGDGHRARDVLRARSRCRPSAGPTR